MGRGIKKQKGFTLLEILIVIAITSILMSVVIIVFNPTEILRNGRDTRRMNDLKSLEKGLSIYEGFLDNSMGDPTVLYISIPDTSSTCANLGLPSLPSGYTYGCSTEENYRKINGEGWIPIDFTTIDIGSPFPVLPIDPINNANSMLFYSYIPGGSFELNAMLESKNNRLAGKQDKVSKDGGDSFVLLEVGSNKNLSPIKDSGLVGYWPFDDFTSGSISHLQTTGLKDASGNNNNGTAYNVNSSGMSFVEGKRGGAISLDGIDDYINCGNGSSLKPSSITIAGWMYLSKNSTWMLVDVGAYNEGGSYYLYYVDGTAVYWRVISSEINRYDATKNINILNNWYYLTTTFDSSSGISKLYINGELVNSKTNASLGFNSSDFLISRYKQGGYNLGGTIDEIRVYDHALSDIEIKSIYEGTK